MRGDLVAAFEQGMGPEARARAGEVPDLESRLDAVLEAGRRAWPELDVDVAAFVRHLGALVATQESPVAALDAAHGSDLYLAFACVLGSPRALTALEREYLSLVPAAVARLRLPRETTEDIAQQVRSKLLVGEGGKAGKLAEYAGRGPLDSWLRAVAMRTALSSLRKRDPSADVAAAAADDHLIESVLQELPGDDDDPEIRYVRERYSGELRDAVRAAIAALPAEERTLLRLYFVEGLSIDDIGRIHSVHRATAARRIARLREGLLENVRRELSAKLHLSPSEFQSVVRAVGSRLEVSLMTLLERE